MVSFVAGSWGLSPAALLGKPKAAYPSISSRCQTLAGEVVLEPNSVQGRLKSAAPFSLSLISIPELRQV